MEGFLALLGVFLLWVVANIAFRALRAGVSAAGRAAVGKGNFKDNFEARFSGMPAFYIEQKFIKKSGEEQPFDVIEIEGRGLLPLKRKQKIKFITSVLDETDGETKVVWSSIDSFQEPTTIIFQNSIEAGWIGADQGFVSLVRVGVVIPEILTPPRGGNRKLLILLRIVDDSIPNKIEFGYHQKDDPAVLGVYTVSTNYFFDGKGYEDTAEDREQTIAATIQAAVFVASIDEEIQDEEAEVISDWMKKTVDSYQGARRDRIKKVCNDAFELAIDISNEGELSLSDASKILNFKASDNEKYQAIELCYEVIAADGVADPEEIKQVDLLAKSLSLDLAELARLKDAKVVSVTAANADTQSLEAYLGIDPSWDQAEVRRYLRQEFAKWNGRINTLTDETERVSAQKMLDAIAEARKKYG